MSDITYTRRWPVTKHSTSFGMGIPVAEAKTGADSPHFADQLAIARNVAAAGFDSLWFADHFSFPSDTGRRGSWDVYTLIAAIAASVPGVTVGPMVACTAYRNPGVIAKMTEMIQDISGGRFILGLGAGWHKPEYDQFGLPFEPRVSRFEEALTIIHGLLRDGAVDHQGRYSQANNAVNLPRAASGPDTPIMIGSSGDRMLGLLAKYGDAWNANWLGSTDGVPEKMAKLDAACVAVGRDPESVVRTAGLPIAWDGYTGSRANPFRGTVDETVAFIDEFAALGFRHLCIGLDPCTPASLRSFAPVVEAFNKRYQ
jgi:alkanesulfonate monooxygenase SsuD/methylene tetrahydromethanopterin reductase-like flavin-dependent oxidoreductase (luciferase family)